MNGNDQSNRLVVPAPGGLTPIPPQPPSFDLERRRSAFDKRSRSQPIILNRSSLQSRPKTNACVSAIVESVSSAALSSLNGLSSRPSSGQQQQRHWPSESQGVCSGGEPRQSSSSSLWRQLPLRARQSCSKDQVTAKPNLDPLPDFPTDRYDSESVAASDRLLQTVPEMTFHAALTDAPEVDGQTEVTIICDKNCSKSPSSSTNHRPARSSFNSSTGGGCRLLSGGGSSLTMGELSVEEL